MNRVITYPGQVPLEEDILDTNKEILLGLARLTEAVYGQHPIVFNMDVLHAGLHSASSLQDTTSTSVYHATSAPNALTVEVGYGLLLAFEAVDSTGYSSLGTDTRQVQKFAHQPYLRAFDLQSRRPTGSGDSRAVSIVARLVTVDTDSVVLPYFNASSTTTALLGSAGSGATQARRRGTTVDLSLESGGIATGGSTPTPPTVTGDDRVVIGTVVLKNTTVRIFGTDTFGVNPSNANGALVADTAATACIRTPAFSRTGDFLGRLHERYLPLSTQIPGSPDLSGYAHLAAPNTFTGHTNVFTGRVVAGGTVQAAAATTASQCPNLSQFQPVAYSGFRIPAQDGSATIVQFLNWQASPGGTWFRWNKEFDTLLIGAVATAHVEGSTPVACWLSNVTKVGGTVHASVNCAVDIMGMGI